MASAKSGKAMVTNDLEELAAEVADSYRNARDIETEILGLGLSLNEASLEDIVARYVDGEEIPGKKMIGRYSSEAEYISGRVRMFSEIEEAGDRYVVRMNLPFTEKDEVLDNLY